MIRPDFWSQPAYPFTASVLKEAARHACVEAPNESCGLVRAGKYVPCQNVSDSPETEFVIAQSVVAEALVAGDLEGVIHSHPGGPWWPSKDDIETQIAMNVPWAILVPGETSAELACHWGGERPPVFDENGEHIPRKFNHYVADCCTLMEDFYLEALGVTLPKVPRDWNWWLNGESLYLDHLQESGFEVISTDPSTFAEIAQPNDAFLCAIKSKTPNHAAAYLGAGKMLDHRFNQLSRVTMAPRFMKFATHWLRYSG